MSRSIKKGPFVAPELYKRVEELNKAGDKKVLKTWSRSSTIFPSFVTSWVSAFPPGLSAATPATRPRTPSKEVRKWKHLHMLNLSVCLLVR